MKALELILVQGPVELQPITLQCSTLTGPKKGVGKGVEMVVVKMMMILFQSQLEQKSSNKNIHSGPKKLVKLKKSISLNFF